MSKCEGRKSDCDSSTQTAILEHPFFPFGYVMLESFEVEHFRSFKHLKLDGLKTVNIIVGKSSAGKTALLEAIRIGLGATPTAAWIVNNQRGIPISLNFNPTREQFESAWKSLFYNFDITEKISFSLVDGERRSAALQMYFDPERPVTPLPFGGAAVQPGIPAFTNTIVPLAFNRVNFSGESTLLDATIHQGNHGQLFLQQGPELGAVSEFFPSTWQSNAPLVANSYSQLRVAHQADDIFQAVKDQFPDITSLSSESPYGIQSIYASVKYKSEMMPLGLISSGLNKFVSLLVAIRTNRSGVVLIDEIENGIYFAMFPALWKTLHSFAKSNRTQLFVSSHSLECIRGATEIMEENPKDFSLIQVTGENGLGTAHIATGRNAAAAIESNIELRV